MDNAQIITNLTFVSGVEILISSAEDRQKLRFSKQKGSSGTIVSPAANMA